MNVVSNLFVGVGSHRRRGDCPSLAELKKNSLTGGSFGLTAERGLWDRFSFPTCSQNFSAKVQET